MFKKILFLFLLLLFKNSFANEVIAIKTYDRSSYIRIVFETTDKPKYFVEQKEQGKIIVKLPDTIIKSDIHKNIFKFNVINDIILSNETNGIKFVISINNEADLMRYLYTEPFEGNNNYRVVIDINKNTNNNLEDLLSNLNLNKIDKTIDDLIKDNIFNIKTLDDLIKDNVKAKDINELLALNNINEEEVTKSFEEQNNKEVDMDDFIKSISIDFDNKLVRKDKTIKNSIEKERKITIIVDAGHGGKDPGAIGLFRTKEKNINLNYAFTIKKEIEKNPNFNVILTRDNDTFIALKDRVNKARMLNADLFISIHADSNVNRKAQGLSIYTLMKSASDTRTVELMKKSNKYNSFGNFNYWRNKIKLDSIRYKNLAQSTKFTNVLIQNFKSKNVRMFGEPHKYGNFAVLLAPEFPSVLIELGFVSNSSDEKMLNSREYRNLISKSIAKSVFNYFKY